MIHSPISKKRRVERFWDLVRDGLHTEGRYARYLALMSAILGLIWLITLAFLVLMPNRYDSSFTLILPGSGVGSSLNLESIGQATTATNSAFSSSSISPTENYKRLLMADVTLARAGKLAGDENEKMSAPHVKLIDQTNLIEVSITADSPSQAQKKAQSLRAAFLDGLDQLRQDEGEKREEAESKRLVQLETKVREAQQKLLAFQGETGLVSLEQFNNRISALDSLQDRERQARTDTKRASATASRIASALNISVATANKAFTLKADPVFQSLLARYATVNTSASEKKATLGPNHSQVQQIDAENEQLKTQMLARGSKLTGLSGEVLMGFADLSMSSERGALVGAMVARDSERLGASAGLADIRAQISEQTAKAPKLVNQASQLADLQRDLRVSEAVFSSALARIDTNKADPFASYPLVQTLEEPSLPEERSSPSTIVAIAGALGSSLVLLIGFGLLWFRQIIIRKVLPNA
ncbi:MAG: hypothetical protein ABJP02_03890 [Parasphingorhabdus sp.]|uniref:GumC family protein n=3 Tax=Parasphingorhabdus sp. TaxID=2709688 RepID=UPI003299125F